jgi:hypothetical protein
MKRPKTSKFHVESKKINKPIEHAYNLKLKTSEILHVTPDPRQKFGHIRKHSVFIGIASQLVLQGHTDRDQAT